MKQGWEIKKLVDICDKASSNVSQNQLTNETGNYPIYGAGGLIKNISFFHRDKEYISIVKDGAGIGRTTLLPAYSSVIGTLQYLMPKENIDIRFLYYFLLGIDFLKHKNGSTIPHIYFKDYSQEQIVVPNLETQKQIVLVLEDTLNKINQAKTNAQKNLQNAKELFESSLQIIFTNKGKGWEEKSLGEMATFRNGMNYTKGSKGEIIKIVGVRDFQKSFWVPFESLDNATLDGNLNDIDFLKEGDILAVRSNGNPQLIGRTLLAGNVVGKVSHSGFTIRVRLDSNNILPLYLCHYLKTQKTRRELVESGVGVGIRSLNQGSLSSLLIPFPVLLTEQQTIVSKLDALQTETKKLEAIYTQKIADLEELKKSILQKAFAGELSLETAKTETATAKISVSKPNTKVVSINPTDLQAGIVSIALQRHQQKNQTHTFHHVKAEKIVHLAQSILCLELDRVPCKDAAGPNDFPHSKRVESRAKKAGFYTVHKKADYYEYSEGTQMQKLIDKTYLALDEKAEKLNNLIDMIVPMTTQQAEIFATVYAGWNNLLLGNKPFTDEDIVTESRENWHKQKLNIEREKFFKAITWMREKNIIPAGIGNKVSVKIPVKK